MQPLAPEVTGPISVCSQSIEVKGNIAGATIDILVNGTVASTHATTTPDNYYTIGVSLMGLGTNPVVTARQTFGGVTSPESLPVTAQDAPTQLSALTIQTHLHNCGRAVLATGATPGTTVDAIINSQVAGSSDSPGGSASIRFNAALPPGKTLTLRQTTCNNLTLSQTSAVPAAVPSPPPAPSIQQPLIECQTSIGLNGVLDGAYIEMYRNNGAQPELAFPFTLSQGWFWIKPLLKTDTITVRQGFNCKLPGPPLETPSAFATSGVKAADTLNAPVFLASPCPSTTWVTLGNLIPGARVVLSQNGQEVGQTDAPATTFTFTTPQLQSGAMLEAHMELCGKKGPSAKTSVGTKPQAPLGLKISTPYACAAWVYMEVSGNIGNYLVVITKNNGQQISPYYNLIGFHALVPVGPALIAGDQITVHVRSCGGDWAPYGPYTVATNPPQPTIPTPVQAGYPSCTVASAAAGAILDVYVDNQWSGWGISTGDLANTGVPLGSVLQVGQHVYCIQTLCGVAGKPTQPVGVTHQKPKRPILLQPADGAHNVALTPTLKWQDPAAGTAGAADSYIVTVTSASNNVTVVSTTATSTSLAITTALASGTVYKWAVTSVNAGGQAPVLTPFTFTTKASPPPQASLKFQPPIYSNLATGFPRFTSFTISVEVINMGNANAPPSTVAFVQANAVTLDVISNIGSANVPQLTPGATAIATVAIYIMDTDLVRIEAILQDSTMAIVDQIFRNV